MPPPPLPSPNLGLSITNPLVLYRALVATKKIKPDPAQHRLALQLQKLYFRLKDYAPEVEYRYRLEKIGRRVGGSRGSRTRGQSPQSQQNHRHGQDGVEQRSSQAGRFTRDTPHPEGGRSKSRSTGFLSSLLSRTSNPASTLALIRTMPLHNSAVSIDSPQGMLLYGEVGRGKSMLLDLLYTSLPSRKKRRWHFNTFMLDMFRRIELARLDRLEDERGRYSFSSPSLSDHEHVVLSLAKDSISDSPILFLDEFQMPDRTASKLVNSFFTAFFHLGGVLVASSNRMPEELSKAAGIEFGTLRKGVGMGGGGFFGLGWGLSRESEGERAAKTDFGLFLEVLRARCEVWEMEGERDWRREGDDVAAAALDDGDGDGGSSNEEFGFIGEESMLGSTSTSISTSTAATDMEHPTTTSTPAADSPLHYHVSLAPSDPPPPSPSFANDLQLLNPSEIWTPRTLTIYARPLHLPTTCNGILKSTFSALCASYLGPADYVSLCSTFHTLILTEVPVLTLVQKNEARRFITLLDALYEARCRLLIEAAAPPDKLFFPETRTRRRAVDSDDSDAITSEAFSEIYQDSTAPFRPNVSLYTDDNSLASIPASTPSFTASLHNPSLRSVLADEDADFGPTYGHGRGHGISNSSMPNPTPTLSVQTPDFSSTTALTGEDERFAYKRARSRLWEMCGRRWWDERATDEIQGEQSRSAATQIHDHVHNSDSEPIVENVSWWRPLDRGGRTWESYAHDAVPESSIARNAMNVDADMYTEDSFNGNGNGNDSGNGKSKGKGGVDIDAKTHSLFRHGASPFRTTSAPPPTFGWQHAWGMMRWGEKAGEWGRGVDALRESGSGSESGLEGEKEGETKGESDGKRFSGEGTGRGKRKG